MADTSRGYLYATHKASFLLTVLNEKTGEQIKSFKFDRMPESLFLSADKKQLYVALLNREHDTYLFEGETGYVGIIDLETLTITKTLSINIDPYDLVVTKSGKLIVSSGSGQWTDIAAFDINTGNRLGSSTIRQRSRLTLDPSENWVFSADTDLSPSDFNKFDISGLGITGLRDSPYHGDHRIDGNIWATPDGQFLITRGGDLFLSSDMTFVRSITPNNISLSAVNFNIDNQLAFLSYSDNSTHAFNLTSFEEVSILPFAGAGVGFNMIGDDLFALVTDGTSSNIIIQRNPCPKCATNTAPQAAITYTPENGDTGSEYQFDASTSSDTESTKLSYRWDIDGNGQWDTSFTSNPRASYKFTFSGTKTIRLQVKDEQGVIDTRTLNIEVAQGIDSGVTLTNSLAFQPNFDFSEAVTDHAHGKLYAIDKTAKRLYLIDLTSGLTEKYFQFEYTPQRLAISTDGKFLYVAQVGPNHRNNYFNQNTISHLATINLATAAIIKTALINADIYDITATSDGHIAVAGDSFYSTNIKKYDPATGLELSRLSSFFSVSDATRMAASSSDDWIYLASDRMTKFKLELGNSQTLINSDYNFYSSPGSAVWLTPDEKFVISQNGGVYLSSDLSFFRNLLNLTPGANSYNSLIQVEFDTTNNLAFLLTSNGTLETINLTSLESINKTSLTNTPLTLSLFDNTLFITTRTALSTISIQKQAHPCPECAKNTAPTALFSFTPIAGNTTETYQFNASKSSDKESSTLNYRWDFEGDGVWDTPFSSSPLASTRYYISGARTARMQVKDVQGLTSTTSQAVDVAQGINAAVIVTDSAANALAFNTTSVLTDATRGKFYITDKMAKRLYFVDAQTGLTEKYINFDFLPENLALSPDGNTLYVSLLIAEHMPNSFSPQQSGYIAVIDLLQSAHTNTFKIESEPNILLATNDKFFVTSYFQPSVIDTYDALNGKKLNKTIQNLCSTNTAIHPNGKWLYSLGYRLEKYEISDLGITLVKSQDLPYFPNPVQLWITPDSKSLIASNGQSYDASTLLPGVLSTSPGATIKNISFDATTKLAFLILSDGNLKIINSTSFETIKQIVLQGDVIASALINNRLYLINRDGQTATLLSLAHPCSSCATNKSPVAAFTISPDSGDTSTLYQFDATNSTDPSDTLMYRWDIDGDGLWDTPFSSEAKHTKQFILPGIKTVRLQVKDTAGAVSTLSQSFLVEQGVDLGTAVTGSEAFTLNLTPTKLVVDPKNSKAYISDKAAKRLYVVNLASGFTEKYFNLEYFPDQLSLSPDGKMLYIALTKQNLAYPIGQEGFISTFDTDQQALINTFSLKGEAFDLYASVNDRLIVSVVSGDYYSAQETLAVYKSSTGERLASTPIYDAVYVTSNSLGNKIYVAPKQDYYFGVSTFNYDGNYALTNENRYQPQDYRNNGHIIITPNDQYIISEFGDIIKTSDRTLFKNLGGSPFSAKSIHVDTTSNRLIVLWANNLLATYSMADFSQTSSNLLDSNSQMIFAFNGKIYAIQNNTSHYKITPINMEP